MRYIFFAPFTPLSSLLASPEEGWNGPFPYPRNLTLTCSDAPLSRLPRLYIIIGAR